MKFKIASFVFIILISITLPLIAVNAQSADTVNKINAYLDKHGLTDRYDNSEERAIRQELLKYLGNGTINSLSQLPPNVLQNMSVEGRRNLVNAVARNYENTKVLVEAGQIPDPYTNPPSSDNPVDSNFSIVPADCYGDGNVVLPNVKDYGGCGWRDLIALVNRVLKFMVFIAASLSTIAFAYAGFLYMTAFGNSGKIEQAHSIFTKTLIGIFFVLVGWLLVATVLKVIGVPDNFSLLDPSGISK